MERILVLLTIGYKNTPLGAISSYRFPSLQPLNSVIITMLIIILIRFIIYQLSGSKLYIIFM